MSAGMEMFFVRPVAGSGPRQREQIAEFAALLGGVVLMATGSGALVLGMPAGQKDALAAHGLVAFVGGVNFNEDGPGVAALRQRFALNAARQLVARGRTGVGGIPQTPEPDTPAQIGRAPWLPPPARGNARPRVRHPLIRFPADNDAVSSADTTSHRSRREEGTAR